MNVILSNRYWHTDRIQNIATDDPFGLTNPQNVTGIAIYDLM